MSKNIWGQKQSGTTGVMSEDDFVAFVISKVGEGNKEWKKNVIKCYYGIKEHKGKTGASHGQPYKGHGVCHHSVGNNKTGDGVSVFFTSESDHVASLIGIGEHAKKGSSKYKLDWTADAWSLRDANNNPTNFFNL